MRAHEVDIQACIASAVSLNHSPGSLNSRISTQHFNELLLHLHTLRLVIARIQHLAVLVQRGDVHHTLPVLLQVKANADRGCHHKQKLRRQSCERKGVFEISCTVVVWRNSGALNEDISPPPEKEEVQVSLQRYWTIDSADQTDRKPTCLVSVGHRFLATLWHCV